MGAVLRWMDFRKVIKVQQEELHELTQEIAKRYFKRDFEAEIIFNSRLRTTGGRYFPSKKLIEINRKYLDELGHEELVGIIKHELCHHFLHIDQKPFHHRSQEFRQLLKETGSPRHCSILPSSASERKNVYKCSRCDLIYRRKRRIDLKRFVCGKCKGKLYLIST